MMFTSGLHKVLFLAHLGNSERIFVFRGLTLHRDRGYAPNRGFAQTEAMLRLRLCRDGGYAKVPVPGSEDKNSRGIPRTS